MVVCSSVSICLFVCVRVQGKCVGRPASLISSPVLTAAVCTRAWSVMERDNAAMALMRTPAQNVRTDLLSVNLNLNLNLSLSLSLDLLSCSIFLCVANCECSYY